MRRTKTCGVRRWAILGAKGVDVDPRSRAGGHVLTRIGQPRSTRAEPLGNEQRGRSPGRKVMRTPLVATRRADHVRHPEDCHKRDGERRARECHRECLEVLDRTSARVGDVLREPVVGGEGQRGGDVSEVPAAPRELCHEAAVDASAADMGAGRAPFPCAAAVETKWMACPTTTSPITRPAPRYEPQVPVSTTARGRICAKSDAAPAAAAGSPIPTARATIVWPATSRPEVPPQKVGQSCQFGWVGRDDEQIGRGRLR